MYEQDFSSREQGVLGWVQQLCTTGDLDSYFHITAWFFACATWSGKSCSKGTRVACGLLGCSLRLLWCFCPFCLLHNFSVHQTEEAMQSYFMHKHKIVEMLRLLYWRHWQRGKCDRIMLPFRTYYNADISSGASVLVRSDSKSSYWFKMLTVCGWSVSKPHCSRHGRYSCLGVR